MSGENRSRVLSSLVAALVLAGLAVGARPAAAAEPTRPNVLLIVLDDATLRGMNDMLRDTWAQLVGSVGVAYENSYVAIPACCPERSALVTGQFPHNNGVRQQQLGGTLDKTTTVAADLHRAGYRTYHVGKYLHEPVGTDPAPGVFDEYLIGMGAYTNAAFNLNGTVRTIPGYNTTVIGQYTRRFLGDAEAADDAAPWYLSMNFKAPHPPSVVEGKYSTLAVPPYTFPDERDRRDKPPYISNQNVTPADAAASRRAAWRTLASVDDQIVLTVDWLRSHGELADTLILLTSDNGRQFGENRRHSKFIPYTPSIRVPVWMRGPGVAPAGADRTRMVSGVDVAATIYDETAVAPSRTLDGESLLRPSTRSEVLVEYFNDPANGPKIPTWATIRGRDFQYIETYDITTGALAFQEYYDLTTDPWELTNLLRDPNPGNDPPAALIAQLHDRLQVYRTCAGPTCPR